MKRQNTLICVFFVFIFVFERLRIQLKHFFSSIQWILNRWKFARPQSNLNTNWASGPFRIYSTELWLQWNIVMCAAHIVNTRSSLSISFIVSTCLEVAQTQKPFMALNDIYLGFCYRNFAQRIEINGTWHMKVTLIIVNQIFPSESALIASKIKFVCRKKRCSCVPWPKHLSKLVHK